MKAGPILGIVSQRIEDAAGLFALPRRSLTSDAQAHSGAEGHANLF